jgi:hypothetical protein
MWLLIYSFVTLISLGMAVLFIIISRFTIYRHACLLLQVHPFGFVYKCGLIGMSKTMRVVVSCTFPNHIDDPLFNSELKITHHATRLEKIIAYITTYSWLAFMLCIVFYYVLVLLGIMEW